MWLAIAITVSLLACVVSYYCGVLDERDRAKKKQQRLKTIAKKAYIKWEWPK